MTPSSIFLTLKKAPRVVAEKAKIIISFYIFKIAKSWVILNRISTRLRPGLWRLAGCNVGKKVSIGYDVYFDVHNASLITVEDKVWIASSSLIFCHKRDMTDYRRNDDYNTLKYRRLPVTLRRGCVIGMGSTIMPGVTVGEGAIVGAGSLVTHDIPAWTIAVGNPARVVREIKERSFLYHSHGHETPQDQDQKLYKSS